MKRHILILTLTLIACIGNAQNKPATIYIDHQGVMRWSNTKKEASFFGVNYTLPFAHAYRAMNHLGKDHKAAIDKDVYHFARLGFNAYRIHIWDVEISDGEGNLLANDHLDLLDYLIYKLEERNIRIVLTAMTNFGNGYPDRNEETGGFSYKYDKCDIHENPEAIKAQANYIAQLIKHTNPYTKQAYKDDPYVVGFEINNEPCHDGTPAQTKAYIETMLAALKKAGNKKPVFYNVSHNMEHIEAYYSTAIQGTTYQWYPIGLVAGHTRQGNFLPYVDHYAIPFSNVKGFANKAKLVYEYDPADITYSYMHPAMARSFRTAGFQWITQFSYDPMDMAQYNTEYQTHYLNLAYTPQKALSMKIAAEAAYQLPRNQSYGKYPNDTLFGNFRVSYEQDLSELNSPEKFFYSNHTNTRPVAPEQLQAIAGYGNSPVIEYGGKGAYFLNKLEEGVWRLEVMPDAIPVGDPFKKTSLKREVTSIVWGKWDMAIHLPQLQQFKIKTIQEEKEYRPEIKDGIIRDLEPGVYLLYYRTHSGLGKWNNIFIGEYAAPEPHLSTAVKLFEAEERQTEMEHYILPQWVPTQVKVNNDWRAEEKTIRYTLQAKEDSTQLILRRDIRPAKPRHTQYLCINYPAASGRVDIGFITKYGFTYKATLPAEPGSAKIPLSALRQTRTALLPLSYPLFMDRYFEPDTEIPFRIEDVEKLEISMPVGKEETGVLEIGSVWLE